MLANDSRSTSKSIYSFFQSAEKKTKNHSKRRMRAVENVHKDVMGLYHSLKYFFQAADIVPYIVQCEHL
jgi:hypothetical protein